MAIAEMGGDQHGQILRTNDALCRLLGRPASAMRRYSFSDLVHPEDIGTLLRTSAESGRAELRLGRRDGTYVWVSLRNSIVADTADGPRFLLTHVEDIEERKLRELQLLHQVSHDSLTDLPNITELRARLSSRLCDAPDNPAETGSDEGAATPHTHLKAPEAAAINGAKGLAVLVCDLDGFKSINDRFGHHTGDMVLVEIAHRLIAGVHDGNEVARVGGNEFAVLAAVLSRAHAQDLAVRLRNEIIQPFRVDGRAMRVGASFGIGWARCGMTADEVLKSADEHMYSDRQSRLRLHRRAG
jgi:diguanylate cyclase (GGDEF)-like protein/PAS domain S-box-containing protein